MPQRQVHDLDNLKQLIEDQEAQGIRFQFLGWAIRLPDGEFAYGAHTQYGITTRRLVITQDQAEARRLAKRNRGELVEYWATPKMTLAIARNGSEAVWWDAKVMG
ncbi:hypothetical protein ACMDCR_26705 [Labrys okinawensis]|uniref:hypothetical protein n=1 Tax=Labrys okinawensis TaxID=346911 RepID=UPI0039BC66F3